MEFLRSFNAQRNKNRKRLLESEIVWLTLSRDNFFDDQRGSSQYK